MAAEARRRGAAHVRQLTILGDGAVRIWNLASEHSPEATQIADLYHAREHLHTSEHPGAAVSRPRRPPDRIKAEERDKALGYFETNPPGCATGTSTPTACSPAPVPSRPAAKAVIGQRLKLSGMHWSVPGATGILTLRCQ